jgi:hypothetical protein
MSRYNDHLRALGLRPERGHDLPSLFDWLTENELTNVGGVFDVPPEERLPGAAQLGNGYALAQASSRHQCRPRLAEELKQLKKDWENKSPEVDPDALWAAIKNAEWSMRSLDWQKLPAESMAFYRPFHFPPFDQWGIYLLIGPLLQYHQQLVASSESLALYSPQTLMHLILFEIFNHEFFHHLVESTATTLEIILATQGRPQPVYLRHRQQQARNVFEHPHAPLEEALANAYAYNALSFISRVKAGYKTATIKTYQKAIVKHWHREPPGYRDAGLYIGGDYAVGGAHLMAQMLSDPHLVHQVPLEVITKHVMPSGFSSLQAKPDIPTWLVGSDAELALFNDLVPAPNEAYTQLFWPYDTSRVDEEIAKRLAEEKAEKAKMKAARM